MARIFLFFFIITLAFFPRLAESQAISGPSVEIREHDVFVSFSVDLDEGKVREIEQGIDKELQLYIDLFKVWQMWPDEFVAGKRFARTISVNPIKKEYVASSSDGAVIIEKRFRSISSMLKWVLSVQELRLANTRELEPGVYYVKITVESRILKLPPVIGGILIFVSENEFALSKKSETFVLGKGR